MGEARRLSARSTAWKRASRIAAMVPRLALRGSEPRRDLRALLAGGNNIVVSKNKLTGIGVYWEYWLHSSFFALMGGLALAMAFVLLLLLPPLKKSMPGV